ncbi:Endoglucanase precursor [compost metagenome]
MKRKISLIMVLALVVNLFMGVVTSVDAASSTWVKPTVSPTELNAPLNSKLSLDFGTSKVKFNGLQTYTITEGYTTPVPITVTEGVYTITNGLVEITPPALKYNVDYKITFPEGAFIDENGDTSSVISWRFSTVQTTTKPTASYYPSAGSSSVSTSVQPTLTFDRNVALNTAKWGNNAGITLRKTSNGASSAMSVSVSGRTVTIRPTSNLEADTQYYIEVPSDAIYDATNSSNNFAGLSGTSAWSFRTAATADKVAPVLQNATMYSNTVIRLQYNESLSYSSYLSSSHFSVTVNGESRRVNSASVSGEYVYVYLDLGVAVGQDVRISYSGSGSRAIQDLAGNAAVNFSGKVVTNGVDSVLPKPREGYANRYSITLYFSDTLKSPSSYAYQQFVVTGDGNSKEVTSLSHSGSSITLNLSKAINDGEIVKVSYTKGSYPLQDYRGVDIASFSDYQVRNYYDTKAPEFQGASGSGNKIILTYNEALRTSNTPLKSQFSVLVNNNPVYVTAVEVLNNQVILTLASSINKDQNVTISYVSGSGGIADLNGNLAGYINLQPVSSNTLTEGIRLATIKGDTITISYNTSLRPVANLPTSQFYVAVDNMARTILSASLNGDTVTLKLDSAVTGNQVVEVSYISGGVPLYDNLGNLIKSYSKMQLQNLTSATSTTDSRVQPGYLNLMSIGEFGVGGYILNQSAAQTSSSRSQNGQSIKKYVLNAEQVQGAFNYLTNNNVIAKNLVFEVPISETAAEVAIPLNTLSTLNSSGKTASFSVKYKNVLYELPINKLRYSEITNALGGGTLSSSYLTVQLEFISKSLVSTNSQNGVTTTIAADPVQIHVSAYDTTRSQAGVDVAHTGKVYFKAANQSSSGYPMLAKYSLVNNSASYIPSKVSGTGVNAFFSGTTSGNSIIGPVIGYSYFSDVSKHWAKEAILELTGKLIAEPRSGGLFDPDKSITRAEFAVFIAKGLGLDGDEANARRFSDVTSGTTAAYIGAAAKAGIITGNTDGSFKPGSYITREQMALMMVRAMDYSGYNTQLSGTSAQYLSKFKDNAKIQNKETVAKAVREGIIQGVTTKTFQPQGNATRAQAAVMLKRVLDKLN